MENYEEVLHKIEEHVETLFFRDVLTKLKYHNIDHTHAVVNVALKMVAKCQLNTLDGFIVTAAAWFHDTGYYNGQVAGHEARGAELASVFLSNLGVDQAVIASIKQCILATKLPQNPKNLLEQIVCDADLYHFGTSDFFKYNKLIRQEVESQGQTKIDKKVWDLNTIKLLESHTYKTSLCRKLLSNKKRENLEALKQKYMDHSNDVPEEDQNKEEVVVKKDKKKKKIKNTPGSEIPVKGIETMFRVTSSNHQRLSDMADNKAHIMITTTSIIISVLLSVLFRSIDETSNLVLPIVMLLIICVVTMVFSILATRPTIPNGAFSAEQVKDKSVNLLFFGNFYKMGYEDYSNAMQEMMLDKEFLYGNLTKDVYSQGVVLGRKYKLLRVAYNIFMYGVIVSVLLFLVVALTSTPGAPVSH